LPVRRQKSYQHHSIDLGWCCVIVGYMREGKIQGVIDLVNKRTQSFIDEFQEYTTGTRVLILVKRSKDGGHQNSEYKRRALRQVTNDTEDFAKALEIMLMLQATTHNEYRVYSTVNPQSLLNGERLLKEKMLNTDYSDTGQKVNFYQRLEDRWVGCLVASKTPSGEKKFIIDVDKFDDSDALNFCTENNIHIYRKYQTKNGWHLIVEPFNSALLSKDIADLQKEGLILIAY